MTKDNQISDQPTTWELIGISVHIKKGYSAHPYDSRRGPLMCYIRLREAILVIRFKIFCLPLSVSSCLGLSSYLRGHACRQDTSGSRNSTPQIKHGIRAFPCGQTRDLFLQPVAEEFH